MAMLPRTASCNDCGKGITANAAKRSGMCIGCGNKRRWADPAFRERRQAGIEKKWQDPVYRAAAIARARRLGIESAKDEELQERRRAYGRWVYANVLSRPDVREKNRQAVIARSGKTLSANAHAWCPPEYRAEYQYLRRTKKLLKAEAQQIIYAQIKADIARLSPFERQQRALERGGTLIANDRGSSLDNPGNYGEERWEVGRAG